jgi:redox-sensing transcriptional repressor
MSNEGKISNLTLKRFPRYLHFLRHLKMQGEKMVSASEMSRQLDLHHTQIRKDLALTGVRGVPKVGHDLNELINAIEEFLNWKNTTDAFLVGAGHMGRALIGYRGFQNTGIKILAAFDRDVEKVGLEISGVPVYPVEKLANLADRMHIRIGIIATPAAVSQEIADIMVASGMLAIWNFAPLRLEVPDNIIVEYADIYSSLAALSHKLGEKLKTEGLPEDDRIKTRFERGGGR